MSARVAILGLGSRGTHWAETCLSAGWDVRGFDPDDRAGQEISRGASWRREATISGAVGGADWVICCLPERLELMRTVIQRAQAAAANGAVIAVVSEAFDVDAVQSCAIRPAKVFRLIDEDGDLALDVSGQNDADTRLRVTEALAVLSAAFSVAKAKTDQYGTEPARREA